MLSDLLQHGHRHRLPRPAGAFCVAALALFAVRCDADGQSGAGPNDGDDPGCSGTVGERGVVRFVFEENAWEDLSALGSRRFATGTSIRFRAVPAEEGDLLPELQAESSDPAVIEAVTTAGARFPHRLAFHAPGTATVRLLDAGDGQLVDQVALAVADPAAVGWWAGPLDAEPLYIDGFARSPSRIWLAPGAGARLVLTLEDEAEDVLLGDWTPDITSPVELLSMHEGRLSVGEEAWVSARTVALLDISEDVGPADRTIRIAGPGGLQTEVVVRRDATPLLEALALAPSFSYDVDPTDPDPAADPAGWARVTQGGEGVLSAVGRTAAGEPALGYPVRFLTSDPRVVAVSRFTLGQDSVLLHFREPGTAVITAVSEVDPAVTRQFRLLVAAPSEN